MCLVNIRDSTKPHARLQFIFEDLAQVFHTLLAIRQGIEERPSNTHSGCSKADCLQDVRAPDNAPVDVDFHTLEDFRVDLVDFEQGENRRLGCVERATPMIREEDALAAVVEGFLSISGALHPFYDDWQF